MSKQPHMLILDPQSILTFRPPFNNKSQCLINVTNPTPYGILFKMKTTASHRYCVKPKMGRIAPYGKEVITVRLKAPKGDTQDKFKLLSFVAPNNNDTIEEAWEKFNESGAMTNKFVALFLTSGGNEQSTLNINLGKQKSYNIPPLESGKKAKGAKKKVDFNKDRVSDLDQKDDEYVDDDDHENSSNYPRLKLIAFVIIVMVVSAFWFTDFFEK
ncbi:vesicle-associated membrane protein-associated protein A-like [Cimex lectularius]|uniref:MSP domain-containing protein n=1 Tax=Cimex lectularius TaxID=79782 RepID=A0A8I6RRE5_CIMLE|nr:vesicle-associated membrane protein-associated protein A-like [Cimex lectularius]